MAKRDTTGVGFRVRPVGDARPQRPRSAPVPDDEAGGPPPPPPPPTDSDLPRTGGRFDSAEGALAFLGALTSGGTSPELALRRGPRGGYWVEIAMPWRQVSALVPGVGGRAFAGGGGRWVELPRDGTEPRAFPGAERLAPGEQILYSDDGVERLPPGSWIEVGLDDLLLAAPLPDAVGLPACDSVFVVAPGSLARLLLGRAALSGFEVHLAPAGLDPLAGGGPPSSGLFMRVAWGRRSTPRGFIDALTRLPYVTVARSVGAVQGSSDRLLVDVRRRMPLAASLAAALVPEGERWILGGADVGNWRVSLTGELVDGGSFLASPAPAPQAVGELPPSFSLLPTPVPVRLAPRPPRLGQTEALLLDNTELDWTRTYLAGRGLGDAAFLAFGSDAHLLIAPAGLLGTMPFGTSLRRIGPGGLFMEEGQDFQPPLPEGARAAAFPCKPGEMVTVTRSEDPPGSIRAHRFREDDLVPVWTLWLGSAPTTEAEAPAAEVEKLRLLAREIAPKRPIARKVLDAIRPGTRRTEGLSLTESRRRALQAQNAGDLRGAAEILEQAGDLLAAARLYEQAAEE